MMKMLLFMFFLIPVCSNFWILSFMILFITFMFMLKIPSLNFNFLGFLMGYDFLSYFLILLSFLICFLMLVASEMIFFKKNYLFLFNFMILMLLISLVLVFCSLNMFMFYLFFEMSLIPTLILIIGWGFQPERIQAGMYLMFYTLMGSMPLMVFMFYCYKMSSSLDYFFLTFNFNSLLMFFMMSMVFLVKIPMFLVHLWLPKAHVEAPVSGSMILAGVMLKLGGYGLMRFLLMFLQLGTKLNIFIINFSLIGGLLISILCIRQSDLKSLIAYSSVVHMGIMLSGLLTFSYWGFIGSLVLMIAHGLCSSGLFVLVNLYYERFMSRSIYILKGMINIMPLLSLWWFLLVSSNMAAPPSLNLLGEIILMNSLISNFYFWMIFLMLISFFSAVYSIYLYSYTQHGKFIMSVYSIKMITFREFFLLMMHWVPLNVLFLKSNLFLFL
uniref:NADH-ubiquinone oxidoreductase chain 4 n=1 Tax=Coccidophilus cariba TaxID=2743657 RepID=A0A6N0GXR2_9CUCU|nr:NADH dehydrogenase subunit 4 [Coccidophilus cariba]